MKVSKQHILQGAARVHSSCATMACMVHLLFYNVVLDSIGGLLRFRHGERGHRGQTVVTHDVPVLQLSVIVLCRLCACAIGRRERFL